MCVKLVNRILLGLLMLVPGLVKLWSLIQGKFGVPGFLGSLGFPVPAFFAWILMLSEIVFGIAVLANWKLKYTTWPPIIILVIAGLVTVDWSKPGWSTILLHLLAASNFWLLGHMTTKKESMTDIKHR